MTQLPVIPATPPAISKNPRPGGIFHPYIKDQILLPHLNVAAHIWQKLAEMIVSGEIPAAVNVEVDHRDVKPRNRFATAP